MSSALASGLLFILIISAITPRISSFFRVLSSVEYSVLDAFGVFIPRISQVSASLWLDFHLPTFDKSYLSKLKNILSIKLLALSGVAKSPGLTLLYISKYASSAVFDGSCFSVRSIYLISVLLSTFLKAFLISKSVIPNNLRMVVAVIFLFLFTFTYMTPEWSTSNSSQAPRLGITLDPNSSTPLTM